MCALSRLSPAQLRRQCLPEDIPFATTAEAPALGGPEVVGQERALEALEFGVGIRRDGYNLFAMGPPGVGKRTLLQEVLSKKAREEETPSDWCYMHNFSEERKPLLLELPAGKGCQLQRDMDRAVSGLVVSMRSTFESEEYRSRRNQLINNFEDRKRRALDEVRERAEARDVAVNETDTGIVLAPVYQGEVIDFAKFRTLPEDRRDKLESALEEIGSDLQALLREFVEWGRQHMEQQRELGHAMAKTAAHKVLAPLQKRYEQYPALVEHLGHVETDAVDNAEAFLSSRQVDEELVEMGLGQEARESRDFPHYRINVFVDNCGTEGAPVVYEDDPSYSKLFGRVEHESQFGSLLTNFTLIRPGAMHRANGGYLVLDALKLLQHPVAWEALKRSIRAREIKVESLGHALGLVPTVTLEPEAMTIDDTKVVLVGERLIYYLLSAHDPDFLELFKVLVDFESTMPRELESEQVYARLIAELVRKEELRPFGRDAVARVIDHASRLAGDSERLSMHMRNIADLLRESDHWATRADQDTVRAEDVQAALDAHMRRSGRVRERLHEAILRGDILVSTEGSAIAQVNGLSVSQVGEDHFGHPTRITARVRVGPGKLVDIEREVDLGGPIHSKGVLILGAYLGAHYATHFPLSLSATLVFEQSYGGVEGDSASLGELCALLSALADAPISQTFAITGSINQHGEVQSIGGVNAKIEGFFDICEQRGAQVEHGVIIPKSNVKHLMLRPDVVEAARSGRFHIHAVEHVDEAMELLTGQKAGRADEKGVFPEGSLNARAAARLAAFAKTASSFAGSDGKGQG